ncbi:hypothetical protein ACVMFB_005409 [Bradyrhizobium sp. USDA 4522]
MRILVATDAWHPQVNGVVRTLTSLARSAAGLGAEIEFLTPDGFRSVGVPTYPGLRVALPNRREIARRIEEAAPEAIHIATEGPIGWAVRGYCQRNKLAFTTSYTTRFPEYVSVRTGIPDSVGYAVLRHFHAAGSMTMVATDSLRSELAERGFRRLGFWTRGVDTRIFNPDQPAVLDLPRPIFMTMGRVAVEKNLDAFLSLDLPGSQGRGRRRPAKGGIGTEISRRDFPWREEGAGFDLAPRCRRRLRVPEPDRHLRRRTARGAGLRHAGRGIPGHRPEGRHRPPSDRRDRQ